MLERLRTQVGLIWTTRFSSDGDENLSLVQRDDLNRTYRENISPSSSQSDTQDDPEPEHTQTRITTWEAGWNVTNAIQGIFVLGLPYAVLQSGYTGLLLLILSALLCCYTGKILISCLYEEDDTGQPRRVRHTYADIANACWCHLCPQLGGRLVNITQVLELMMTCILYLVVSSNLLCNSFPFLHLNPATCSALTFLTLMPCMLIRDLKMVSRLSFLCSLAHFVITFVVIGYCLRQAPQWAYGGMRLAVDFDGFLVAAGVIIFSYTSQIFLPALEGCMADRGQFGGMMNWTHALACVLKTVFSLLALLTWGEDTKEVVSDNLPSVLRMMVNLCLLVKALLSFPLPFYSAAELLQTGVFGQSGRSDGLEWISLILRASLLLLSFVTALCVPQFSLLMGLTGSVTGAVMTLLLPTLFHLTLKHGRLDPSTRLMNTFILSLGCVCSLAGVIRSIRAILTLHST